MRMAKMATENRRSDFWHGEYRWELGHPYLIIMHAYVVVVLVVVVVRMMVSFMGSLQPLGIKENGHMEISYVREEILLKLFFHKAYIFKRPWGKPNKKPNQLKFKSELWMKSGCLLVDFSQLSRWMLTHDPLRHRHSDHYATSDKSPIVQEHHHHELHHDIWKMCGNTFLGRSAQLLGTSSLKVTPLFKNTVMSRSTVNMPSYFDLILKWQKNYTNCKNQKKEGQEP